MSLSTSQGRAFLTRKLQKATERFGILHSSIVAIEPVKLIFLQAGITLLVIVLLLPIWRDTFIAIWRPDSVTNISERYFQWIQPYYFPAHKFTILAFILTVCLMGAVVLVAAMLLQRAKEGENYSGQLVGAFVFSSIITLCLLLFHVPSIVIPMGIGLVLLAMLPSAGKQFLRQIFLIHARRLFGAHKLRILLIQKRLLLLADARRFIFLVMGLSIVSVVQCSAFYWFLASGQMPLMADFMELPTTTILRSNPLDPGTPVDTVTYINQNGIWGNQQLPDYRRWPRSDAPCSPGNSFNLPRVPALEAFVEANKYQFYFSAPGGQLCFVGRLDTTQHHSLSRMFPDYLEPINAVAYLNSQIWEEIEKTFLSEVKIKLLRLNEGFWKTIMGTPQQDLIDEFKQLNHIFFKHYIQDLELVFHHHFQFLNPIKEFHLGRPLSEINASYGLSFLAVNAVMQLTGGLSHQSFLAAVFGIQLIYWLAFIGLVVVLYRNPVSTFLVSVFVVGILAGYGGEHLFIGVGYGSIRHGFDLVVIGLMALYFRRSHPAFLVLAIAAGLANMLLDRLVGAFCPLALAAVLLLRGIAGFGRSPRLELAGGILTLGSIAGLFVYLGTVLAPNPYASGFFDGVWGFPVTSASIIALLLPVVAGVGQVLWSIWKAPDDAKFLPLFLLVYFVVFISYWFIIPNFGHLYKTYPVLALAVISLWHECLSPLAKSDFRRQIGALASMIGFITWSYFSTGLVVQGVRYNNYFDGYALYDWSFARIKARSNADPQPLIQAMSLIEKVTTSSDPVYILSEFDTLLLFLSNRTSAMAHFEVPRFLNSPKHQQMVIEQLRADKPARIIVDSCIVCSAVPYRLTNPITELDMGLEELSILKVDRLQRLKQVYQAIADDYEFDPELSGGLISVLRRKSR